MSEFRFSANTGFLFRDLPFLDRIRQAAARGFDAVEFHDEAQDTDRTALREVLADCRLPVVGLNVRMGGTFGCAAVPGQTESARRGIDEAIALAADIGAGAVHVLAGIAEGPGARATFLANLRHALEQSDRIILIEPIAHSQVPGYFLRTPDEAAAILAELDHPRLKILFDCYHVWAETGEVEEQFRRHAARIGHVQIAAAEDRAEPTPGALDYSALLPAFRSLGFSGPFGCEYRPRTTTEAGLGWRTQFRATPGTPSAHPA